MKNIKILLIGILLLAATSQLSSQVSDDYLSKITEHLVAKDETFNDRYPEYTIDGIYKYRNKVNWLSGFISGELWNMYDITGDGYLELLALKHADALIEYANIDYTHDMGFIFLPTCVEAYKRTGNVKYRDAAVTAAQMLAKRFNKNGNFIRAWGKLGDPEKAGLMIIDTMMNLELLFWAAKETGDYKLYDIAYKHAITCMNESVRSDFTSYHVVEFNPESGNVIKKHTHQGVSDESTWARGQAWGIYGFASAYKFTQDERFLNVSKKMADVFIEGFPDELVPYWDLTLSGSDIPRDASAAAIASSGMYLLSDLCNYKEDYLKYRKHANEIAESLINNYTFMNSDRNIEQGLVIHTVYNFHKDWGVDESFPCGDYYFTEVLKRYFNEEMKKIKVDKLSRQKILLNDTWFYLEDNSFKPNDFHLSNKKWEKVNLPHTWNNFDAVDAEPGYRRDGSWYQKNIEIKTIDNDKLYKLYFEGVNISCDVYVNGKNAGGHIGGYVGFEIDITSFIHEGENVILVRADNSINKEIIPSQLSDFFIYGGITRDVWLKVVPRTNISKINISTPEVSANSAETNIEVTIKSHTNSDTVIFVDLIDPNRVKVLSQITKVKLINGTASYKIELDTIEEPILWSTEQPNLYTATVTLLLNDIEMIDKVADRFGFRWFEFKDGGPFYLNGKRLLLRGTHRHEDFAGMGNALSNDLHRNDIKMIKEMGANFVRLAHYPQDPEIYKTCDELGLLVWDELPWCRGGVGNQVWKENTKRLLKEMINQNFNHPSIIIWSVGNEVYWLPEFKNGGDIDSLRNFVSVLNDIAHKLDPGRVTSIRKFYEGSDIIDLFSPSIWSGWYSGVYKNYEKAIVDAQKKYFKFFHAEYGGSSHLGRHTENPITGDGVINPDEWSEAVNQVKVKNVAKIGDWSENYIVDLFDWHLRVSEQIENFTGNAQWAFRDFGTPLRPENAIPYVNQKGLLDREGNPKDAYYVFKSYWKSDPKFCYIESHTWTERSGPKELAREVSVYSNYASVELILNDKSLGSKKKDLKEFPASGLNWSVNFQEGLNKIIAVGNEDGEITANDTLEINYTYRKNSKPVKLILTSDRISNGNHLITASAVDKNGQLCLNYNDRVYFSAEGKGKLIENYGVPGKSSIIEMANGKASIEFESVPFEKATIEVRNQNFKGSYLEITE